MKLTSVQKQIALNHFGAEIVKSLARRNIHIIGLQAAPAFPGDRYLSATYYVISRNGCCEVKPYAEILRLGDAN